MSESSAAPSPEKPAPSTGEQGRGRQADETGFLANGEEATLYLGDTASDEEDAPSTSMDEWLGIPEDL